MHSVVPTENYITLLSNSTLMLDAETVRKIEEFVYKQPCSIQEIAQHVGRNWRTVDRYVSEIEKEYGTLSTRVFRGGTRGALKIAYWASVEKLSKSVFQEKLESDILSARRKEDFSAFEIFQHVDDSHKKSLVETTVEESSRTNIELVNNLRATQKQLIILSGNLSFTNLKNKSFDMFEELDRLVKRGVSIKIISRVDIAGLDNIERVLQLNQKYGKELIEIRHREQPIRAFIFDGKSFRIKEIREPTGKIKELDKKIFIFYTITDKAWVNWLTRLFWKMFSGSILAERRIVELKKLKLE
jgi:hypothetical protein